MAVTLPAYENYDQYRARVQWQLANGLSLLFVPLLFLVSAINAFDGRTPSAVNAFVAALVMAGIGILSWRQGEARAGQMFYRTGLLILGALPLVGLLERTDVHYWFYPFAVIAAFVFSSRWLLAVSLGFGVYASLCLLPLVAGVDVARFAASYLATACLTSTYSLLVARAGRILRYYSEHDPLTGCLNRRSFHERLASAGPAGSQISLILLDIDHFKAINDRLGHQRGDQVLAEIARLLRSELAPVPLAADDSPDVGAARGWLYRYGGEEFAVMLPGADEGVALATAERLRRAVAEADLSAGSVTLSAGVATWDPTRLPIGRAVDAADRALYQAKHAGRDRVVHSRNLDDQAAA